MSLLCALISITGDVKLHGEDQLTSLGVVKSLLCVATRAAAATRADERFVKKSLCNLLDSRVVHVALVEPAGALWCQFFQQRQ